MRYSTERGMEGDSDEKGAKQHVRHKMTPPTSTQPTASLHHPQRRRTAIFFSHFMWQLWDNTSRKAQEMVVVPLVYLK